MAYRTLLFDLDGTLLNTLDDLAASVNYALLAHGYPQRTLPQVRAFVGDGVRSLMAQAVPEECDEAAMLSCLDTFRAHYGQNMANLTAPYPGIRNSLAVFARRGVRMAVISNKYDAAVKALSAQWFGQWIDVAIGERPGVPRKPAPDALFAALGELGVSAEGVAYVGDSPSDVVTARRAGLPCVGVTWGFRDEQVLVQAGADIIVRSPAQLINLR